MTENKRFIKSEYDYDWWFVFDKKQEYTAKHGIPYNDMDGLIPMSEDQVIKLLNENEKLKEQLEICKNARQSYKQDWKACVSYCDTYQDEIYTLKDNIQGLIEENKELKEENKKINQRLRIHKDDHLETLNDLERAYKNNIKALNNIERLGEENDILKEQVNEMIDIFNDSGLDYHISDELEEILNE